MMDLVKTPIIVKDIRFKCVLCGKETKRVFPKKQFHEIYCSKKCEKKEHPKNCECMDCVIPF